jgi:uncharacterized protein
MGTRPIFLVAGAKDGICPAQNARKMYESVRSPEKVLLILPNAQHGTTYSTDPQLYESTAVGFLDKALQSCCFYGRKQNLPSMRMP